ncbi:hypothetical protein [Vogesella sp. EB]|uniref:hypothetical protein n=1 Tax=Vogesella sp. EB TaxID=1526735 RepID=UPI0012E01B90|nr:hypothetical protein [Vogesella sp. EB]
MAKTKQELFPGQEMKCGKPIEVPGGIQLEAKDIGDECYLGPCVDGVREQFFFAGDGCTDGPYYTTEGCEVFTLSDSIQIAWEVGGASNVRYYQTQDVLPKDTAIKVKVAKVGKENYELRLREIIGNYSPAPFASILNPVANQVLPARLSKNMKFAVQIGGANFTLNALSVQWNGKFFEMTIEDGWLLHIKVSGDDF